MEWQMVADLIRPYRTARPHGGLPLMALTKRCQRLAAQTLPGDTRSFFIRRRQPPYRCPPSRGTALLHIQGHLWGTENILANPSLRQPP